MTDVWLSYRLNDLDNPQAGGLFVCEYHLHGVELHRPSFGTYREAEDFARRKATKKGTVTNAVPEHLRRR